MKNQQNLKELKQVKNYGITENGIVYNLNTGFILKPYNTKDGYHAMSLRVNGKKKRFRIHQLVATNYIPKINEEDTVINHIDGNKENNSVSNLEWTTVRKNTIHAYELQLSTLPVRVDVLDIKSNVKITYRSVQHLSNVLNVDQKLLLAYIKYSYLYPFMGKYIITVHDENRVIENLNSINHGKPLYVHDYIEDKTYLFKSIGAATYITGIRSLNKLKPETIENIGYCISQTEFKQKPLTFFTLETLKKNRQYYLSKPYSPQLTKIAAIDLLSKDDKVLLFNNRVEFNTFIFNKHHIDINSIRLTGIKLRNDKNSRLFLGYNIQLYNSETDLLPWSEYTLEEIINSRNGNRINTPIYEVILPNKEKHYLSALVSLLGLVRPYIVDEKIISRNILNLTLTDILKAIGSNIITINRISKMKI